MSRKRREQLRQKGAGQGGEKRDIVKQREGGATETGRREEGHPGAEREGSN